MEKTGFISLKFEKDTQVIPLGDVTSLTISNYGNSVATVIINDVARTIPAFRPEIAVPFGSFNLPGDGTRTDLKVQITFAGGNGQAILDYRKIQETC